MISTAKPSKMSVVGTAAARKLTRPAVATLLACALALLLPAIPAPCCYDDGGDGSEGEEPAVCPDGTVVSGYLTPGPIYLRYGAVIERPTGLHVPGPVPDWLGAQTSNSSVQGSAAMGGGWVGNFVGFRLIPRGINNNNEKVELVVSAISKRTFDQIPDTNNYTSPADSFFTLEWKSAASEFLLTNWATGEKYRFHDFSEASGAQKGLLIEDTTRAWQPDGAGAEYTHEPGSRELDQVTTADGQDYNVVFIYTGDRITKIEVRTGQESSTRIREVNYTYFDTQSHSPNVGSDGDLVQVTMSALRTGGSPGTPADWIHRHYQYRYDSNGMVKGVFEPDAVQRLIDDRADISAPGDILTKGDDDDNSGAANKIRDYASRWFTYYTVDVKTDNSGAGTSQDPKCATVWAPSGENLQTKYGGSDADEVDSGAGKYLVKSETVGGCSSCGSTLGRVKYEYFYMQLDHGTPDPNEVVWMVVEDLSDAQGNGIRRNVYGLEDSGRALREATILDPVGTPQFWCRSRTLETSGQKLNRLAQERTPAAHNVSSSTIDEFLNPSHNGTYTNDEATLHGSAGLIHVYEYNDSGDRTGERIKQGRTGTAYYVAASDYYGGTK